MKKKQGQNLIHYAPKFQIGLQRQMTWSRAVNGEDSSECRRGDPDVDRGPTQSPVLKTQNSHFNLRKSPPQQNWPRRNAIWISGDQDAMFSAYKACTDFLTSRYLLSSYLTE
jgi:hypothetical protein